MHENAEAYTDVQLWRRTKRNLPLLFLLDKLLLLYSLPQLSVVPLERGED